MANVGFMWAIPSGLAPVDERRFESGLESGCQVSSFKWRLNMAAALGSARWAALMLMGGQVGGAMWAAKMSDSRWTGTNGAPVGRGHVGGSS